MMKKLSIGSWAYIFNQEKPTNDFHEILHKLQHLGYEGVELGSFGAHPTPCSHPTKAERQKLKKEVADHGLEFSGIAVDLWGFKKPGRRSWTRTRRRTWRRSSASPSSPPTSASRPSASIRSSRRTSSRRRGMDPKVGMDRIVTRLGQVQQDRRRPRHERLLGVRAGLPVQQAVGSAARSSTRVRAKGNPNFGVLYDTCHAHMCAAVGANQIGEKETLPGGELELLEKLKGKITHVHLIDSRRLAQRAQHQHAQPVRHRQAELRQADAGAEQGGRAATTGGASICASGPTPGT